MLVLVLQAGNQAHLHTAAHGRLLRMRSHRTPPPCKLTDAQGPATSRGARAAAGGNGERPALAGHAHNKKQPRKVRSAARQAAKRLAAHTGWGSRAGLTPHAPCSFSSCSMSAASGTMSAVCWAFWGSSAAGAAGASGAADQAFKASAFTPSAPPCCRANPLNVGMPCEGQLAGVQPGRGSACCRAAMPLTLIAGLPARERGNAAAVRWLRLKVAEAPLALVVVRPPSIPRFSIKGCVVDEMEWTTVNASEKGRSQAPSQPCISAAAVSLCRTAGQTQPHSVPSKWP